MSLDLDALVAPLSEEAPSGPDLYADADRQVIEQAFERSISLGGAAASEADWGDVIRRIVAQGAQTRDLWLPVYLMRAAAQSGKFDSVVDGAEWLARLAEERWADVHPQLEEVGFIGRKAPCEALTRLGEFLNPIQQVPLFVHARLGAFTGADIQRFHEEGPSAENYGMFRAALEATPAEEMQDLAGRIDRLIGALRRADAVLTANAEGDTSTNFTPTYDALGRIRRALETFLPAPEPAVAAEMPAEAAPVPAEAQAMPAPVAGDPVAVPASAGETAFSGAITSREDVKRAIDSICLYYEKYEPTSPVPFALRRAREWISLDFITVLEDIAPGSLGEAEKLLKTRRGGQSVAAAAPAAPAVASDDAWGAPAAPAQDDNTWGASAGDNLWG